MANEVLTRSGTSPAQGLAALAIGAAAVGAIAIGAVAIGQLAIGRLSRLKGAFGALEVDELTARKLRVIEREGPSG